MKKSEVNALAKCPKCNAKMYDNCCVGCGYMPNGNFVGKNAPIDKFKDLKLYNNSFEKMVRNEKKYIAFILGPIYFSYRSHFLVGLLISAVDILFSNYVVTKFNEFLLPCYCSYVFIKRFLYMMFANSICLKLDKWQIGRLKIKHKNYEEVISTHEDKSVFKLLLHIIFYFTIVLIIMIYR